MKNKKNYIYNKSLRTFYIYSSIVFLVIIFSLSVKAVLIFRQSKFDGRNINFMVSQKNRVVAIYGIDTASNSTSFLKIKNDKILSSTAGMDLGLLIGGRINSDVDLSNNSEESILTKALLGKDSTRTDLTFFDILRLVIFSKNTTNKNRYTSEINQSTGIGVIDKTIANLFKDSIISAENISIEVINATNEPGLGKRLERCLINMGANVVAVTTPHINESTSKIQYLGARSYTVEKLSKILKFKTINVNRDNIAKIVIIIGKDNKETTEF